MRLQWLVRHLLNEQERRTSTPHRWRSLPLWASTARLLPGADHVRSHGQHLEVSAPSIGEIAGVSAVAPRQRPPDLLQLSHAPRPQHAGHDALTGALDGQSALNLAPFVVHKRPHIIWFQGLPPFPMGRFRAQLGQRSGAKAAAFLRAWQSCYAPRQWCGRCCATSCARPATGLLAHTTALLSRPPAGNSLSNRRLCTGTWPTRRCARCAKSGHWYTWRRNVACKL